jgi:hypothetical protein
VIHYDVHGNLWAQLARLGGIIEIDPRDLILGFVPIPNGDAVTRNFIFGGPHKHQYIYFKGAMSGTFQRFKAPYPGLIGPGGGCAHDGTVMDRPRPIAERHAWYSEARHGRPNCGEQAMAACQAQRGRVERFFGRIDRNRRLARDFEATIVSTRAFPLRRLRHAPRPPRHPSLMTFETGSKLDFGHFCECYAAWQSA